jgi:hypothetical protein
VPIKGFPSPKHINDMNANKFLYQVIQKTLDFPTYTVPQCTHLRNVAEAHARALTIDPVPGVKTRLILNAGYMEWAFVIEFLKKHRPAIASRLPDISLASKLPCFQYRVDTSLSAKLLKLEYIPVEDILLEVIDDLLVWEQDKTPAQLDDTQQPDMPSEA